MVSVNPLIKPFVKWAGGKRQLVPTILANHLPKNYNLQTYYEPFIGGGALLFSLQPKKAVINDSNAELINCYKIIKNSLDELIEDLKNHKNDEYYYYDIRDWDREKSFQSKTEVQRASRIIFLNKTCYNGLFRVNSQGQFNVPFGKFIILNSDFQQALKDAKRGDFIYLDPPYDPISETASFTGYDVNGFNKQEQRRLKEVFDDLNSRGCNILLSNAYTEFIQDLYKDYPHTKISAIRAINCHGKKRGKVDEILVKNYE
jgi:DNA adenine methylase